MSAIRKPSTITSSKKQKSVFEPGDIEEIRHEQEQEAERQDSYRNGLYANRKEIYRTVSNQTTSGEDRRESYRTEEHGKLGKLRKLFKKEDSDPYAATYDQGNSKLDSTISAIHYVVPAIRTSRSGPADPRFDDTGVNR